MDLNRTIILALVFMGLSCLTCFAQTRNDNPTATPSDIVPPAPDAASLGRYGQTPVSLYHGTPSIEIPIYNFSVKDFTLPIQLSYNASGIRVDEVAGTAGLGWSLEAGGVITSVMHGRPDLQGNSARSMPSDLRTFNPSYSTGRQDYEMARQIIDLQLDTEPDVFFYNFAGRKGKFVFSADRRTISLIPFQPLKIIYNDATSGPGSFTVIDEKGVKYDFRHVEFTGVRSECDRFVNPRNSIPNFAASWYLSKVTTPLGAEVLFSYTPVSYGYAQSKSETVYKQYNGPSGNCADLSSQDVKCTINQRIWGQRLASISSSVGKVRINFTYNPTKREDLLQSDSTGNNALAAIRIYSANSLIQEYTFTTSYFRATGYSSTMPEEERVLYNRLRLDAVRKSGEPAHVFTYGSTYQLPKRLSFAQDRWGFYNGRNNNSSLIPYSSTFNIGSDREPYEEYILANILTAIRYPTGGQTKFEYQSNFEYTHQYRVTYHRKGIGVSVDSGAITARDTITIRSLANQDDQRFAWYLPIDNGERTSASITGSNGYARTFSGVSPPGGEQSKLQPGTYTFRIIDRFQSGGFLSYSWRESTRNLEYIKKINRGIRIARIVDLPGGGQPMRERRFRYQRDSPAPGATVVFATPGNNLGTGMDVPKLDNQTGQVTYCTYQVLSSSTPPTLGEEDSGVNFDQVVVYEGQNGLDGRVIHTFTRGINDFVGQVGGGAGSDSFDGWTRGLPLTTTYQRFDVAQNKFLPVKKEMHAYYAHHQEGAYWANDTSQHRNNERWIPGYKLQYLHPQYTAGLNVIPAEFIVESFVYNSAWYYEREKQEITFHPHDSTLYSVARTVFQYTNPHHAQLTRQVSFLGTGRQQSSTFRYPLDFDTSQVNNAAVQALRQLSRKHILTPVISQQQWNNSAGRTQLVGGRVTHFANLLPKAHYWWAHQEPVDSTLQLIPSVQNGVLTQDVRFQLRSTFESYTSLGLLDQHRIEGKLPTSFLWGYRGTLPIVQAEGCSVNQIAYTSFEPTSTGRWQFDTLRVIPGGQTGTFQYQLGNSSIRSLSISNTSPAVFQLSFWASTLPTVQVNGNAVSNTLTAVGPQNSQGLRFYAGRLTLPAGGATVTLTASGIPSLLLDELRLHPIGVKVTGFTYAPLIGMTSQTDASNHTLRYEYDASNRLVRVRDDDGKLVSATEYQFALP